MVHQRRGFTLVELLVVVVIVLAVSVIALPSVINAIGERQMGEATRPSRWLACQTVSLTRPSR